ncbi:type II toxin-antitoxin system RelE family toxin [Methylobacterium nodulans]|nr:type II toxin-antitoxin system RelE/ParE family toxin [Methylobacterium nodulans]
MKAITYTPAARKSLAKLPEAVRDQLRAKLRRYAETGAGDVKALSGRSGRRLRSGDYRVIFEETDDAIEVVALGHRRDIYE